MNPDNFKQLLREFHAIYKSFDSSDDETKRHIQTVRTSLSFIIEATRPFTGKKPEQKPVCRYLESIIKAGEAGPVSDLVKTLKQSLPYLGWEYGYETMPEHLYDSYAYTEIAGPNGNVYSEKIAIGLVLLAPGCHYPEHLHPGIEESYICLHGRVTQNTVQVLNKGDFLYNRPGTRHSLTAGADDPCLLGYSWIAMPDTLLDYSMKFA